MMFYLNCIYLFVSLFSTYCIITNTHLQFCNYTVGFFCGVDYFLFFIKCRKFRWDIFIHHLSAFFIIAFFHFNQYSTNVDSIEKDAFIKNVLVIEVSSIFLSFHNLLENTKFNIIKKINQTLFVSTFVYFRIYNYPRYVIFSEKVHFLILTVSENDIDFYIAWIGLYGICILNFYWFFLLLKKMHRAIQQNKRNVINYDT